MTQNDETTIQRALRIADTVYGMNQTEFAEALGVTPQVVSNWKNRGAIPSDKHELVADLLGISVDALLGRSVSADASSPPKTLFSRRRETPNVEPAAAKRKVPLISWVAAGGFGEVVDVHQLGAMDDWVDVYDTIPGDQSFALRVEGDSMTSPFPGDLSFPHGTIIVVDPMRPGSAGDFVVAKDVQTQRATFKKLVTDGGRWYLKPLNPSYPIIEIDDPAIRVIGRVIEFMLRGKL